MTTATASIAEQKGRLTPRQRSIALVTLCTVLGAAAQILIKLGATALPNVHGIVPNLMAMAGNLRLVAGYGLYGVSTVLLVLALREGELSLLYPVIALTYVWVSILSVVVFHEAMSIYRITGIAVIVCGVAILGRETRK